MILKLPLLKMSELEYFIEIKETFHKKNQFLSQANQPISANVRQIVFWLAVKLKLKFSCNRNFFYIF